ncbi:MAG: trigger factor [Gammaproteobacteria bacterium]
MPSKLTKLKALERKLTVTIPSEQYLGKFNQKIKKVGSHAKLDGFRKGKVPTDVLKQRYGDSVHFEVLNELIQESYPKELDANKIKPASHPKIQIESEDSRKAIIYTAVFEVFPEIKPKFTRWSSYDKTSIEFDDQDIKDASKDIQSRYCHWHETSRSAQDGDRLDIDFEGTIAGEAFEGNNAKNFQLELGSKSMIPGFEEQLVGHNTNDEFSITCSFPESYFKTDLAGKEVVFKIKLNKIEEKHLAKLDKELFEALGMEAATEEEYLVELRKRMSQEVALQEDSLTKESIYELLLKTNSFDAPHAIVQEQAALMRKDSLMRIGKSVEDADDTLFPLDTFLKDAEKRVKLDLLFSELVKHFEISVSKEDINAYTEEEASKYKDPTQFKEWVKTNPRFTENYRMIILEKKLIEKLEKVLKSKDKRIKFKELANKT